MFLEIESLLCKFYCHFKFLTWVVTVIFENKFFLVFNVDFMYQESNKEKKKIEITVPIEKGDCHISIPKRHNQIHIETICIINVMFVEDYNHLFYFNVPYGCL